VGSTTGLDLVRCWPEGCQGADRRALQQPPLDEATWSKPGERWGAIAAYPQTLSAVQQRGQL